LISVSFEDLAQALRVLLEADYRAHTQKLLFVDRAEAVGNIEAGLNSVVNAFHSLYDATEKQLPPRTIEWYHHPELATILAIRNARHHNKANKIRQLYNFHVQTAPTPQDLQTYVAVDFPAQEEGADTFDVYLSWADLDEFLRLPTKESKMRAETVAEIRNYLAAHEFPLHAARHGLALDRVFFNVVPLIVNAAGKLVPFIKPHIDARSTEARAFATLFEDMPPALTKQHEATPITIFLPD
jgi:hypothetical protein